MQCFHFAHIWLWFVAEEILDDGVGLFLESSGDSLDDDSEILSDFACSKVRAAFVCGVWLNITTENTRRHIFHTMRRLLCLFSVLHGIPLESVIMKSAVEQFAVWRAICNWLIGSCSGKQSSVYYPGSCKVAWSLSFPFSKILGFNWI